MAKSLDRPSGITRCDGVSRNIAGHIRMRPNDAPGANMHILQYRDVFPDMHIVFKNDRAKGGQWPLRWRLTRVAMRLFSSVDSVIVIGDIHMASQQNSVTQNDAIRASYMYVVGKTDTFADSNIRLETLIAIALNRINPDATASPK
jgi:hypothetical protein